MQLSSQAISEFQKIMSDEFGVKLTVDQANVEGLELLSIFKDILQPIPTRRQKCDIIKGHSSNRLGGEIPSLDKS
jgi:hypothetical protein